MSNSTKSLWFEGEKKIQCSISTVEKSLTDLGRHYKDLISLMKGMTSVELMEQGNDFVILKTNEGTMKRTNISVAKNQGKISIEFDEEYQAGKTLTTKSHFVEKFNPDGDGISLRIEISDLKAPGLMGFFYRNFGSKNIGNAFLDAYKNQLEE